MIALGCYLYCIAPAGHTPTDVFGIDRAPVDALPAAGLCLWVSPLAAAPEPTVERVKQHNGVVLSAITDQITPVPVRFGQWADTPDALRDRFGPRAPEFSKLLSLFAGALEFGLRVLDPRLAAAQVVQPVGPATTGREYLAALRDRLRARQPAAELEQRIHTALAPHVKAERVEPDQTTHGMLSMAHLVDRSETEAYRARVQELRAALPELRFLLSGPWPPYTFAA